MLINQAAERNKIPILEMIKQYIDDHPRTVLEIASGTGQHVAFFAPHFPNSVFQPSEIDENLLKSQTAYIEHSRLWNVKKPIRIDVTEAIDSWNLEGDFIVGNVDIIININMIHISSNAAVDGLFKISGRLLRPKTGLLITYGPYAHSGVITPQSNVDFNMYLRSENPEFGYRDVEFLKMVLKLLTLDSK